MLLFYYSSHNKPTLLTITKKLSRRLTSCVSPHLLRSDVRDVVGCLLLFRPPSLSLSLFISPVLRLIAHLLRSPQSLSTFFPLIFVFCCRLFCALNREKQPSLPAVYYIGAIPPPSHYLFVCLLSWMSAALSLLHTSASSVVAHLFESKHEAALMDGWLDGLTGGSFRYRRL